LTVQEAETLRALLAQRNTTLLRDWLALEAALLAASIPPLLDPYRSKLIGYCRYYRVDVETNLALLKLGNDAILEDLLSKTQVATNFLRIISSRLASPVLRSSPGDALCLKILTWIHQSHPQTAAIPAAFASGDVAVWPLMRVVPVYFFPSLEQGGLLFQPLHYHESGHGLYVLHKPEMDDLIKELQETIAEILTPLSQRNDRHAGEIAKKRQSVVNRWFEWAQEVFCDAVGLTLGGPAYLYAFSAYCNSLSKSDLYMASEDLERSKHPVTWLRIRLLVKRAEEMGLEESAVSVEQEWKTLASVMQITEEYHGYFEDSMEGDIHRIIGDMLAVASPRSFLPEEVGEESTPEQEVDADVTPSRLLNRAWQVHLQEPHIYADWEQQAIEAYMGSNSSPTEH
jgi:hypothetical protein